MRFLKIWCAFWFAWFWHSSCLASHVSGTICWVSWWQSSPGLTTDWLDAALLSTWAFQSFPQNLKTSRSFNTFAAGWGLHCTDTCGSAAYALGQFWHIWGSLVQVLQRTESAKTTRRKSTPPYNLSYPFLALSSKSNSSVFCAVGYLHSEVRLSCGNCRDTALWVCD